VERAFWRQYTRAYEDVWVPPVRTSHPGMWCSRRQGQCRLIVSALVIATLEDLKLRYPKMTVAQRTELRTARKLLAR